MCGFGGGDLVLRVFGFWGFVYFRFCFYSISFWRRFVDSGFVILVDRYVCTVIVINDYKSGGLK